MELRRLTTAAGTVWESIYALYEAAFPLNERREKHDFIHALTDERFYCMVIFEDEAPIGFLTYWDAGGYLYLEHFATLPAVRGRGYGAQALEWVKGTGRLLILEAELAVDEITRRRIGFYRRAGFLVNAHRHLQPPYHAERTLLELCVMSYPRELSTPEYREIYAFIWQVVTGERYSSEN